MRIPETRYTWPIQINISFSHVNGKRGGGCQHGTRSTSWPWWKHGAALWCALRLDPKSPCTGRRLWLYSRWCAVSIDIVIDRRSLPKRVRDKVSDAFSAGYWRGVITGEMTGFALGLLCAAWLLMVVH